MLRVDFNVLSSAAALCGGQADHVAKIKSYVSDVCDRPQAFRGVLNLFEGSYCSGINSALAGLENSVQIGDKMSTELTATREDFIETDLGAYTRMRKILEDVGAIVPYQAPGGSGDYARGGTPPPRDPGEKKDLDGLDGGDFTDAARDHALRDTQHETDQPDKAKSHKDRYSDWMDRRTDKVGDERRVDENAAQRQKQDVVVAGQQARDDARADGASKAEASNAGAEARRDARAEHRDFNAGRDPGGRAGAYGNDIFNEGNDLYENVQDFGEHLDNIGENFQQDEDLDEFRDRDEDKELQEWANR